MIIVLLCLYQFAAGETCEISQIKNDNVSPRSRQITFPNGRQLIVIGHNHGDRDNVIVLSKLTKNQQVANEEFSGQLKKLVDSSQQSVTHANQDFQFLRTTLETNKQIQFVAIEGSQEAAESNLQYFNEMHNNLNGQVARRNLPPSPYYRWAVLTASGAVNYLKMTEPQIFGNRKLQGFEADESTKKHAVALAKFDLARDQLKELAKDDSIFLKKITETYGELMAIYGIYEPREHDVLLLKESEKQMPPKYKTAGMIWMKAAIEEMQAMKGRDRAVVENMVAKNQSGLLFTGLWHLDSVAQMLKQRCLQESGISIRKDVNPSSVLR